MPNASPAQTTPSPCLSAPSLSAAPGARLLFSSGLKDFSNHVDAQQKTLQYQRTVQRTGQLSLAASRMAVPLRKTATERAARKELVGL